MRQLLNMPMYFGTEVVVSGNELGLSGTQKNPRATVERVKNGVKESPSG